MIRGSRSLLPSRYSRPPPHSVSRSAPAHTGTSVAGPGAVLPTTARTNAINSSDTLCLDQHQSTGLATPDRSRTMCCQPLAIRRLRAP